MQNILHTKLGSQKSKWDVLYILTSSFSEKDFKKKIYEMFPVSSFWQTDFYWPQIIMISSNGDSWNDLKYLNKIS